MDGMQGKRVIHADDFVSLSLEGDGVARYARSDVPYASLADLERSHDAMLLAVEQMNLKGARLLVDLRRAPPRNDQGFEVLAARYIARLAPHVSAVAWLVKTAVGKLQIARLTGQTGQPAHTFHDEASALAFLEKARA